MLHIISNDDGELSISVMEESQFLEELAQGDWGEQPVFLSSPDNPQSWPEGAMLIIQGAIIVPQPEQVATRWKL